MREAGNNFGAWDMSQWQRTRSSKNITLGLTVQTNNSIYQKKPQKFHIDIKVIKNQRERPFNFNYKTEIFLLRTELTNIVNIVKI